MANIRVPCKQNFNNFHVHITWFKHIVNWIRNSLNYSVPSSEHFQDAGGFLYSVFHFEGVTNLFLKTFKSCWVWDMKRKCGGGGWWNPTSKECCPSTICVYRALILLDVSESTQISGLWLYHRDNRTVFL